MIEQCPPPKINRQSSTQANVTIIVSVLTLDFVARVLVTFYTERLDDSDTVIPALKGLLCLSQLPTFTAIEATEVFQA